MIDPNDMYNPNETVYFTTMKSLFDVFGYDKLIEGRIHTFKVDYQNDRYVYGITRQNDNEVYWRTPDYIVSQAKYREHKLNKIL